MREYLMQNLDERSVLLNFTSEPLNKVVTVKDFYKRALLIDKPYGQLLTFIRAKAQEYLSIAMGSPDWNEMAITIFDAMDQFNLHYQRLITVLQGLDIAIVTGESWEPEYTIAMLKSEVYQVREGEVLGLLRGLVEIRWCRDNSDLLLDSLLLDLEELTLLGRLADRIEVDREWREPLLALLGCLTQSPETLSRVQGHRRSEERRVGKECRSRWSPYH